MRNLLLLSLIIILTDGCVDPLTVKVPDVTYKLVVDGYITNEPGPYTVKIYRARPLNISLDQLVPEKFAKVFLKDDAGNTELLTETEPGIYLTSVNGMQGQVGRSYHLEIETVAGATLFSDPEEIKPAGTIENVTYEFVDNAGNDNDKFKILTDATGVEEREDLIRFRMVGTWEVFTYPELRSIRTDDGVSPYPFPCSGYVNRNGYLTRVEECTCCRCWVNEYDEVPVVVNEQYFKDEFNGIEVGHVAVNRRTFYNKFRVEVQMLSLTQSTYEFWRLVRAQKLGTSDLFQPPFSRITGNLHSSDPTNQPLGIFWAAGVAKRAIVINREDVPYSIPAIDTIKSPCLFFRYSTNQKPSFWN